MITSNVLLYPDTGEEFLSALRAAVFYSEHVFALTMVDTGLANNMLEAFEETGGANHSATLYVRRLQDYFKFVQDSAADLRMLAKEGVFTPLYPDQSFDRVKECRDSVFAQLRARFEQLKTAPSTDVASFEARMQAAIRRAFDTCPPSYGDLDLLGHIAAVVDGRSQPVDLDVAPRFMMLPYLLLVAAFAESRGASVVTWKTEFREAVWACRELFCECGTSLVQRRCEAVSHLGQVVVERHLPAPDRLRFEAVLELRRKNSSELFALRTGVAELASQVDVTQSLEQQNLQVHDLVLKHIDPAIRNLRASISMTRLAVLKDWGDSWSSIAGATIPAVISFAYGAPLDVSAVLAALGSLIGPIAKGTVASKGLRHASQWSLLLRLEDKKPT